MGVLPDATTQVLALVCTSAGRLEGAGPCSRAVSSLVDAIVLVVDPTFSEADAARWLSELRSAQRWEGHLVLTCRSRQQRERLGRYRVGDGGLGQALENLRGHAILGPQARLVELAEAAAGPGLQAEYWLAACQGPAVLARAETVVGRLGREAQRGVWTPSEMATLQATCGEIRGVGLVSLFPSHEDLKAAIELMGDALSVEGSAAAADLLRKLGALIARSPWNLGTSLANQPGAEEGRRSKGADE